MLEAGKPFRRHGAVALRSPSATTSRNFARSFRCSIFARSWARRSPTPQSEQWCCCSLYGSPARADGAVASRAVGSRSQARELIALLENASGRDHVKQGHANDGHIVIIASPTRSGEPDTRAFKRNARQVRRSDFDQDLACPQCGHGNVNAIFELIKSAMALEQHSLNFRRNSLHFFVPGARRGSVSVEERESLVAQSEFACSERAINRNCSHEIRFGTPLQ